MKVVTAKQMQELDRLASERYGVPTARLMERAGEQLLAALDARFTPLTDKRMLIVAGKGHNGGDGLVLARLLRQRQIAVDTYLAAERASLQGLVKDQLTRLEQAGGAVHDRTQWSLDRLREAASSSDVIVDALLGTGLSAPVEGLYAELIQIINHSGVPVLAVDLPSGINADTGHVMGSAVRAQITVTFALPKLGLLLHPGAEHAGHVIVGDIGIPQEAVAQLPIVTEQITPAAIGRALAPRAPQQHKGHFGHLLVIAGSVGKTGAAALCALGGLRGGAGLVTIASPSSLNATLEGLVMEAMTAPVAETVDQTIAEAALPAVARLLDGKRAVALGPGLSQHPETQAFARALLPTLTCPTVIDADGLNALAGHEALVAKCRAPMVLTPHPGEMARLLGCSAAQVEEDRPAAARDAATRYRAWVVLKGARTLLAAPDGRLWINTTGNPGMATGGTGDVLTGLIGGFLAQSIPLPDAAAAAIYLHGLAGDLAAEQLGQICLIAGDLLDALPAAFRRARTE
ncbi:MAG: NAD(P)H-hydrate dehydratase [Nitrospirota bacterium]